MTRTQSKTVAYSGVYVYGTLHDTVSKRGRSYTFFLVSGLWFSGVLSIVQAEQSDVYAIEEITGEFGEDAQGAGDTGKLRREFLVAKADRDAAEYLYCVGLPSRHSASGKPSCTCFGYNTHQHCKHIDCLFDLLKRGQI